MEISEFKVGIVNPFLKLSDRIYMPKKLSGPRIELRGLWAGLFKYRWARPRMIGIPSSEAEFSHRSESEAISAPIASDSMAALGSFSLLRSVL